MGLEWTAPVEALGKLKLHLSLRQFLLTAIVLGVSALAASLAADLYGDVAAALIFVLGITIAGALCGLASALVVSLVAFLIYNFYLTEPALTFRLATGSDIAPLVIFNLCGLVAGILAGRLKDHAEAARLGNLRLENLLELSQALQSAARPQDVAAIVGRAAYHVVGAKLSLFRSTPEALVALGPPPHEPDRQAFAERVLSSESAIVEEGRRIGRGLEGTGGTVGVMVIEPFRPGRLDPTFVNALSNMIVLAIERAALSEEISERRAMARAEELKTALLGSVSHDFRTPLTAISASASSLIAYRDKLDAPTSARLLRGIVDECERLNRYTANLLEMSRLETGGTPARLQTLSVSDMVGAAVARVRARAGNRSIARTDENDLLVAANAALFELVLINVLDNAIVYSDDGTRIHVAIERDGDRCRLTVADEGHGIPPGDLDRVFDRFHRVARAEASPRGSGLGLAIAKGFVEALGGTIEAQAPGIGDAGTRIVILLPVVEEVAPE